MALTATLTKNPHSESEDDIKSESILKARNRKSQPNLGVVQRACRSIQQNLSNQDYIKAAQNIKDNRNFHSFENQHIQISSRHGRTDDIEFHRRIMERRLKKNDIEVAKMQDSKREIEESTKKFSLSKDIPNEIKAPVLEETASLVHDIYQASLNQIPIVDVLQQKQEALLQKGGVIFVGQPKPPEIGQPPELSKIPQWKGRQQDGKPLDFIREHYGQWLSAFDGEQDYVFQDQIRAHDSRLIKGIHNQLREEGQGRKIREFVKPRSARLDRELENVTVEDLKQNSRLAGTLYIRQRRATKAKDTPSSHSARHKK